MQKLRQGRQQEEIAVEKKKIDIRNKIKGQMLSRKTNSHWGQETINVQSVHSIQSEWLNANRLPTHNNWSVAVVDHEQQHGYNQEINNVICTSAPASVNSAQEGKNEREIETEESDYTSDDSESESQVTSKTADSTGNTTDAGPAQ